MEEHRKLMSMPTFAQMLEEQKELLEQIAKLEAKKDRLVGGNSEKIDEKLVIAAEKDEQKLRKELKKYKSIVKSCLDIWTTNLEKKKH